MSEVLKIGLVDVDGHNFPNIALMKISAWHKGKGDDVDFINAFLKYDKVYMSKVFDFTPDFETVIHADEIIKGGRAYDKKSKLPAEVECMYPDYSLYNINNEAYGYLTRGCPRGCEFCDVVNIEGKKSYKVADLSQFWKGQKQIKLLDPNLLACKDRIELLQQLADSKAWIDFTQGLDARLLNDDVINLIKQTKIKMIHFAWDSMKNSNRIIKQLINFKQQTNYDCRKLRVYVLTNFGTTTEEDLYRVYKLKELGYDPYVMIYDKQKYVDSNNRLRPRQELLKEFTESQIQHFIVCWKMQRWVDNKFIFRSCERFEDYQKTS